MSDTRAPLTVIEQNAPSGRLSPIVAAFVANGTPPTDPKVLGELLEVQQKWEANEARKQYTQALVALKRDLPSIIGHDSVVDFTSSKGRTYYTHTSLAGVMAAVTEHLSNHGFSLNWTPSTQGNMITVICRLTHSGGHFEEATLSGQADAGSGRNALQAVASAITYLSRYSALALLGIATADMKEPEPQGTTDETIDVDRNLAAVGKLANFGKTREDAEKFLGKPVREWTIGDLGRLKSWAKPRPQE